MPRPKVPTEVTSARVCAAVWIGLTLAAFIGQLAEGIAAQ